MRPEEVTHLGNSVGLHLQSAPPLWKQRFTPLPLPEAREAVLGEKRWLPLTIVPLFSWCFGELNWLLQSSFQVNDPFLNHLTYVLDPLLLGFYVGSLESHREKE